MNTNETFDTQQTIQLIRRNATLLLTIIALCAATSLLVAGKLPKRFKSLAIINIQTSYFQNPMVNDLVTPVNDPSELQAQRMSLLRTAMAEQYIDSLAQKYDIYDSPYDPHSLAVEREKFSKQIEYFALNSTTFQISVSSETAELAQELTGQVLTQMRETLIEERYSNLVRTRNAILNHIKSLGQTIKTLDNPKSYELAQAELEQVEGELHSLLMKFTDVHPEVLKLRQKANSLKAKVKGAERLIPTPSGNSNTIADKWAKEPSKEVYSELLKKLNYLTIVLDMEKDKDHISYIRIVEQPSFPPSPLFPNRKLFLLIGLAVGAILGSVIVFMVELGRRALVTPYEAALLLETPLFGELPRFEGTATLLIDTPKTTSPSHQLAHTPVEDK